MDNFTTDESGLFLMTSSESSPIVNATTFDWAKLMFFNNNTETVTSHYSIIFDPAEQGLLIGLYIMILTLGLTFNGAIIWVIMGEFLLICHISWCFGYQKIGKVGILSC